MNAPIDQDPRRAEIVRALESGAIVPIGTHHVMIGGAAVDADVYQVGEDVHLEIDCNQQTVSTALGEAQVNGMLHIVMNQETFANVKAATKGLGAKMLAAANMISNRTPLLRG